MMLPNDNCNPHRPIEHRDESSLLHRRIRYRRRGNIVVVATATVSAVSVKAHTRIYAATVTTLFFFYFIGTTTLLLLPQRSFPHSQQQYNTSDNTNFAANAIAIALPTSMSSIRIRIPWVTSPSASSFMLLHTIQKQQKQRQKHVGRHLFQSGSRMCSSNTYGTTVNSHCCRRRRRRRFTSTCLYATTDDSTNPATIISRKGTTTKVSSVQHPQQRTRNNNNYYETNRYDDDGVVHVSMQSALGIVPPDDVWDSIQKVRYMAQDTTYTIWPPCIRLFHPFVSIGSVVEDESQSQQQQQQQQKKNKNDSSNSKRNIALDIANIIELYNIGTFTITLSKWSIIPHIEYMSYQIQQQHQQQVDQENQQRQQSSQQQDLTDDEKVQLLIRTEEQIGKQKMLLRQEKMQKLLDQQSANNRNKTSTTPAWTTTTAFTSRKKYKNAALGHQQYNTDRNNEGDMTYNGPCVICLEPDSKSKEQIQAIRYLIQYTLFGPAKNTNINLYTSPSGSVTTSTTTTTYDTNINQNNKEEEYRPVVPIAAFSTVSEAIQVAKRLRSSWVPLSFNVTDLHILSSPTATTNSPSTTSGTRTRSSSVTSSTTNSKSTKQQQHDQQQQQYSCDALITLMGVELPNEEFYDDDNVSEGEESLLNTTEMIQMLCDCGEPGGYYYRNNTNADTDRGMNVSGGTNTNVRPPSIVWSNSSDHDTQLSSELERWLHEEDEEYDEGTVIMIGRAQFFTGEMRHYVGMPATKSNLLLFDGSSSRSNSDRLSSSSSSSSTSIHEKG